MSLNGTTGSAALVLKKLVSPNTIEPPFTIIDKLPAEAKELAFLVLSAGTDRAARDYRLRSELAGRGLLDLLTAVDQADPRTELEQLPQAGRWEFKSLADAYQPLEPLQWVVTGVIARPSLSIFYGPPKSFKSLLLMDLCICAASGENWLASPSRSGGFETIPTITAWIDLENGPRRMAERFAAFGKARKLSPDANLVYISMPSPWLDASKAEDMGRLMRDLEEQGAGLVVVDHFSQILGQTEENSSAMAVIMANLRGMVEHLNLALVLLHHTVKNLGKWGISPSDALRGHGSILASADLACVIERQATNSDAVTVKAAACRGPSLNPFGAQFSYSHKTDGSLELDEARFWGMEVESINAQIESAIIEFVGENPGSNQQSLRAGVADLVEGAGDPLIRKLINRMEKAGKIVFKSGKQNAKLYRLPEVDL